MSKFSDLARLKELDEATKTAPDWPCPVEDAVFCEAICDASPWLLKIAEAFQPGDGSLLGELARDEEQMAKFVSGFGKPDLRKTAMLRRLQAAAEAMER